MFVLRTLIKEIKENPMQIKFHEDYSLIKEKFERGGLKGDWSESLGEGKYVFKMKTGPIINWWPKTGTVAVQAKEEIKTKLEAQVCELLEHEYIEPKVLQVSENGQTKGQKRIFIVHGHDKISRDQLELALRRLGLDPFILMNTSGEGKTIIEALEGRIGKDYASDFGIALMTPDDFGYSKTDGDEKKEPRARQNVILETGMLLSSLTRNRMALIVKGHLELPSDIQGLIRFDFNEHIREVLPKLVARMRESGIAIDEKSLPEAMA